MFDYVIQKKLSDLVTKPTSTNDRENVPYSDDVDPDHSQLPEDDDPVMPDSTAVFENPLLINAFMQN